MSNFVERLRHLYLDKYFNVFLITLLLTKIFFLSFMALHFVSKKATKETKLSQKKNQLGYWKDFSESLYKALIGMLLILYFGQPIKSKEASTLKTVYMICYFFGWIMLFGNNWKIFITSPSNYSSCDDLREQIGE